jgi:hypothetical protein
MNATKWLAAILSVFVVLPPVAFASDVDTQFIFGFTQGADVGELGEKEIEWNNLGRFGKADGSYTALSSELRAEFTPLEHFRFEAGVLLDYHAVAGVSGLDDRAGAAFGGFVLEARYRILDRRDGPFGLTIGLEPHWMRVDETSGEPITNYGGEILLSIDKELIENRLFGALNLLYDPEVTHFHLADTWQGQSTLGISGAVTAQVDEGIFFGAELHYLRTHDGAGLDVFAGDALFIGPTTYARLSRSLAVSAAWSVQVAGRAVDVPGSLNLRDFERHQARLRVEYTF